MAARRKLIVVSNRGPVSFARDEDGNRVTRRGGGGLVTALRSFVAHHDVTWIASAMTVEDRAVVDESGGEAVEEVARDGSPYRLRLVAHDPAASGSETIIVEPAVVRLDPAWTAAWKARSTLSMVRACTDEPMLEP